MVEASGAGLTLRSQDLPLLPGALALAEQRQLQRRHEAQPPLPRKRCSGGSASTRRCRTRSLKLLCESETSGGLLFAVDPKPRRRRARRLRAARVSPCWEIGEVTAEPFLAVV